MSSSYSAQLTQSSDEEFTSLMRKVTRKIHNFSDALVQSKFLFGLIEDRVWAEGLLVFYRVFEFLEACMDRLPNSNLAKFKNENLMRTKHFQKDLAMYYGDNWEVEHPDRESVKNYIQHLQHLEAKNPDLLIAYVYHLYLGLLSGGLILRKKQKLVPFSKFSQQSAVVDFERNIVSETKKFIKRITNEIAETLNADVKERILEESITVFKLNCDLIRSVRSAQSVVNKYLYITLFIFTIIIIYLLWRFGGNDRDEDNELK